MTEKVLLLGSGELGKKLTFAYQEQGRQVIAVGHYANAPAMQVADAFEVTDMTDGASLDAIVKKHSPDYIIPETEEIHSECLKIYQQQGIQVAPSAKANEMATNRKAMRHLADKVLKLRTPNYLYASNLDELIFCVKRLGLPCVVKSLTSSSGNGQSLIKESTDIEVAWNAASRESPEHSRVMVEQYIPFESEITLLTVTQKEGPTLFCPPIGHRQARGDYQESWQPDIIKPEQLDLVQKMAQKITWALGGAGLWGVEFFLTKDKVYFSEVGPRPHDTGLVTLAGTQNLNQFQLHAMATLGLPIPEITLERAGASAVILTESSDTEPSYSGLDKAKKVPQSDVCIFGKPLTRPYRRMGVALAHGDLNENMEEIRARARQVAKTIQVK
ncbi:MAG: formate-dependent phosphoribosylglycinamide formyltransferase [Roseivirga sp.]|nr:formate-dependent phosphoribosylglycinamide formyltransferase [Roseivirga sp.]